MKRAEFKDDPVIQALEASRKILGSLEANRFARPVTLKELRNTIRLVREGIDKRFELCNAVSETLRIVRDQWLYQG